MSLSMYDRIRVDDLYRNASRRVTEWRVAHYYDFRGVMLMNPADLELIANEQSETQARQEGRPVLGRIIIKHGDAGTLFGKRCRADIHIPRGCIEMALQ